MCKCQQALGRGWSKVTVLMDRWMGIDDVSASRLMGGPLPLGTRVPPCQPQATTSRRPNFCHTAAAQSYSNVQVTIKIVMRPYFVCVCVGVVSRRGRQLGRQASTQVESVDKQDPTTAGVHTHNTHTHTEQRTPTMWPLWPDCFFPQAPKLITAFRLADLEVKAVPPGDRFNGPSLSERVPDCGGAVTWLL